MEFEIVTHNVADLPAEAEARPCGGFDSHEWHLTIKEGSVGLASGCYWCDSDFHGTDSMESLWVGGGLVGRLKFHPDHPGLGGWHGDTRCDCGWTWEFVVDRYEPEDGG